MALSDWTIDNIDNLLIGGSATATLATAATETEKTGKNTHSVARVAAVAVASRVNPKNALPFKKALKPIQRAKILNWLDAIGETDTQAIKEVLAQCETDQRARRWYLDRAVKVSLFRLGRDDMQKIIGNRLDGRDQHDQ